MLDVGSAFGGSSIDLAANYHAAVTGMAISPVQVAITQETSRRANVNARFLVMDADHITMEDKFDVAWSIECSTVVQCVERSLGQVPFPTCKLLLLGSWPLV
jgi:cyclopropane fatty-acyl-phospholipid synthase-like methyltransferase